MIAAGKFINVNYNLEWTEKSIYLFLFILNPTCKIARHQFQKSTTEAVIVLYNVLFVSWLFAHLQGRQTDSYSTYWVH